MKTSLMMKAWVSAILLLTIAPHAGASEPYPAACYQQITSDYSHSSRVFQLSVEEWEDDCEELSVGSARRAVDILLKRETSCDLAQVTSSHPNFLQASCHRFPGSGVTCSVPTKLGYFIVHRSAYGVCDAALIYTRWD